MGDHANGRLANGLGTFFLIIVVVVALAAIPLMLATKAGM
jgi:hypothetical protein